MERTQRIHTGHTKHCCFSNALCSQTSQLPTSIKRTFFVMHYIVLIRKNVTTAVVVVYELFLMVDPRQCKENRTEMGCCRLGTEPNEATWSALGVTHHQKKCVNKVGEGLSIYYLSLAGKESIKDTPTPQTRGRQVTWARASIFPRHQVAGQSLGYCLFRRCDRCPLCALATTRPTQRMDRSTTNN